MKNRIAPVLLFVLAACNQASPRFDASFVGIDSTQSPPPPTSAQSHILMGSAVQATDVLTQHNDNKRTGQQLNETVLNTSTVYPGNFGKLYILGPVVGGVNAEPLYVTGLKFPDGTTHNTVIVASQRNNVYAFDADNPNMAPMWNVNLGPYEPAGVDQETGILSTPVIDRANGVVYLVNLNYPAADTWVFKLHALNLVTGAEMFNGPVVIDASIPSTAPDATHGVLTFSTDNVDQWQRTGLLLVNKKVYFGFASHDDTPPYHGWVFGYDAATLKQIGAFCATPNTNTGGFWGSGQGLIADANNDIWADATTGIHAFEDNGSSRAESILHLHQNANSLVAVDYFTPNNFQDLDANDWEIGQGGSMWVDTPQGPTMLTICKDGNLYVNNPYNLGKISANNANALQVLPLTPGGSGNINFCNPVLWNSPAGQRIFTWAAAGSIKSYLMNGLTVNPTPVGTGTYVSDPEIITSGFMSVSANGNINGSGLVWGFINKGAQQSELHVVDALNVNHELWNSSMNANDAVGAYSKMSFLTIANGKVFMPTYSGYVSVFGLKNQNATGGAVSGTPYDVLTQHNNAQRTGVNTGETILTTANVNTNTFGKLFSYPIDGPVYAQPLYVGNQPMGDGQNHNVVYIATGHEHLYAFDADNAAGQLLWETTMGPYVPASYYGEDIGILGTPVINRGTNSIYFVTVNEKNGTFLYSLHALDLTTGQENFDGPATLNPSAPGTAPDNVNGLITFNPAYQEQRAALLDVNGHIYISFGSIGSNLNFHGWVMSYSDTTLKNTGTFLSSANTYGYGISDSGQGLVADANNDILVSVDEGGEEIIKLRQTGISLTQVDQFRPTNWQQLNQNGSYFGLSGVSLMPGPNGGEIITTGLDGNLYNIKDSSLGGASNANAYQVFGFTTAANSDYGNPVYWNSSAGQFVYAWPMGGKLSSYALINNLLSTTPVSQSTYSIEADTGASGMLSVSANGNKAGTGIVWAVFNAGKFTGSLHAYNAANLTTQLWDSTMNANDSAGAFARLTVPTVANGKVYVVSSGNAVNVYGLKK